MKDRLYLLTGASGLLGGNILRQLVDKNEKVRVLVSPNNTAIASMPQSTEIIIGDLLDKDSLDRFFTVANGVEIIVIHAAALVTMDPRPDENVYLVNVEGTKNIIGKCLKFKVKKLIYISSIGAIPELAHGIKISEVRSHNPDLVVGYYSKTKAIATDLVLEAVEKYKLDASVIYPSGIFGPNDYRFGMITSSLKMVAKGKLRISIAGTFNSVDVRDLAKGVISCSEKGKKGETYIMAGDTYTFTQLIDTISKEMKMKGNLITIPLWIVRPFANLGLIFSNITKKPAWFSKFTIYNLSRNNVFSSEKAKKELGFKSRSLDETLIDTISWLKEIGEVGEGK